MNKFRVVLHPTFFDPENFGKDYEEKEESVKSREELEHPYDENFIKKATKENDTNEKKAKEEDEKRLKELGQTLGIGEIPEITLNDIDVIKNFNYDELFEKSRTDEFVFKSGVEKTDQKGKYIEVGGKKVYEISVAPTDGISYNVGQMGRYPNSNPYFAIGSKDYTITIIYNKLKGDGGERSTLKD